MKKISVIIVGGIVFFIGILYYTLRTKVRDISDIELYTAYFNKKLVLKKGIMLVKSKYFLMSDPDFVLTAFDINLTANMQPRYTLREGTIITLNDAKAYLNATTGDETNYVLGTDEF